MTARFKEDFLFNEIIIFGFFFMWLFLFTEKSTTEPLLTFTLDCCKSILQTGADSLCNEFCLKKTNFLAIVAAVHYIMSNQTYIYISVF